MAEWFLFWGSWKVSIICFDRTCFLVFDEGFSVFYNFALQGVASGWGIGSFMRNSWDGGLQGFA